MAVTPLQDDINRDLGLGSRVAEKSRVRFLNRDGSFNVIRRGLSFFRSQNTYHALITMSWSKFFFLIVAGYFATNAFFALCYLLCGADALQGFQTLSPENRLLEDFFFSIQTIATIGYGGVSPATVSANLVVSVESLVGLLGFALVTGLLFARFSRPSAQIIYSQHAIVAPYRGATAFEFRIANERSNELIELACTVTMSRIEQDRQGNPIRKFYPLTLERDRVVFFPLHWVVVHPIDGNSPLNNETEDSLRESDAEFLILVTGTDETFSQTVHSRSSYKYHEVRWGWKFSDMFLSSDNQKVGIDLRKIHDIEKT
ncbi:MAG TPA: ion channel [Bacteroidota bacterium]|nr:ion channel [Bacteroidota bacterium]